NRTAELGRCHPGNCRICRLLGCPGCLGIFLTFSSLRTHRVLNSRPEHGMIGGTKTASEIPCLAENRTMWFRGVQCVVIIVLALLAAIAVAPAVDGQRRARTGAQEI